MTVKYRVELIEEAQELIRQAIYNIQTALYDTDEVNYYQSYLIRNLRNMIDGEDNPYDANLDSLIKNLQETTCEYSGLPSTHTYQ